MKDVLSLKEKDGNFTESAHVLVMHKYDDPEEIRGRQKRHNVSLSVNRYELMTLILLSTNEGVVRT